MVAILALLFASYARFSFQFRVFIFLDFHSHRDPMGSVSAFFCGLIQLNFNFNFLIKTLEDSGFLTLEPSLGQRFHCWWDIECGPGFEICWISKSSKEDSFVVSKDLFASNSTSMKPGGTASDGPEAL